jgi:hypothetical protein
VPRFLPATVCEYFCVGRNLEKSFFIFRLLKTILARPGECGKCLSVAIKKNRMRLEWARLEDLGCASEEVADFFWGINIHFQTLNLVLARLEFNTARDEVSTTCGSGWVNRHINSTFWLKNPPATAGGTDFIAHRMTLPNKWQSVTKQALIIEVWEALDCESVGRVELERIQEALAERFGEGAVESPAAIARTVADEGAVLRHPEIFESDFAWREKKLTAENPDGELSFVNLAAALASFAKVEERRLEIGEDAKGIDLLRKLIIAARHEKQLASQSQLLSIEQRNEAAEVAEWLSVWLRAPQLFADWLELRMRSSEFKKNFPQITQITRIPAEE